MFGSVGSSLLQDILDVSISQSEPRAKSTEYTRLSHILTGLMGALAKPRVRTAVDARRTRFIRKSSGDAQQPESFTEHEFNNKKIRVSNACTDL